MFADARPEVNALFADQFGVWVTGVAPIRDSRGDLLAVVVASLPPFVGAQQGGLRAAGKGTLASILQSAAVRADRGEIDAIADGLTGLYNHRYLHERLSEELRRAEELETPLSLLFCDLDEFKEFNDTLGHGAGDNALRSTAHILEQSIRHIDLASRYGGEEFVVALIGTDAAGAARRRRAHPPASARDLDQPQPRAALDQHRQSPRSPPTDAPRKGSSTRPNGPCTRPSACGRTASWRSRRRRRATASRPPDPGPVELRRRRPAGRCVALS